MQSEAETTNPHNKISEAPPKVSEARYIFRVMFSRWVVVLGAVIIVVMIVSAIFAPQIAPYPPNEQNLSIALQQPSGAHLLGTDPLGRDILSRIIYGSRVSLMIGIVAVGIASFIGMLLGLIAGYFGKLVNNVIMRFMDAMMSIPPLVMALVLATAFGNGLLNVMLALGIAVVPGYCRLMCGQVLSIKESDYLTAAHIVGTKDVSIMLRHVLPNAFPPLLVLITLNIGTMILSEAGLSFLGVGVIPPTATWGSMVSKGYPYLFTNPLLSFGPGIAVILVVLAFNLVGDGFRDALDPRLRGTL
jgi:peptide/nickel transport system permease protein